MTVDHETLMAYADGECDPLTARRVERAIAADPALATEVDSHRALRTRLGAAFAQVADEPVPPRLTAPLTSNVVPFAQAPRRRVPPVWAGAVAASLVIGLVLGRGLTPQGTVATGPAGLVAEGTLARALDTQVGGDGAKGGVRMLASFRATDGELCRVFTGAPTSGIACRNGDSWALRRTISGTAESGTYRQAGTASASLLADAQDMMADTPLDAAAERDAARRGWR
ncbi:anti-sigma factor family protein [Sphingomonas floccifaciens]|uniref:Anti-sigma factor family protein n=1 Tax=Sphingomonas floccifaciens TaxID=1844115 RepID=A0ABW4NI58_9SPHN